MLGYSCEERKDASVMDVPDLKHGSQSTSRSRTSSPVKVSELFRPKNLKRGFDVFNDSKAQSKPIEDEIYEDSPWYIKFAPVDINDVAIHKKKLGDVTAAFLNMLQDPKEHRVLLLTGPSGCSKSTVIKLLAENYIPRFRAKARMSAMNVNLVEDRDCINEYHSDMSLNNLSHMESFAEYLRQSKYLVGQNLSVLLVEDLPNVFQKDVRQWFQKLILQWLYSSEEILPPLVICLTECDISSDRNSVLNSYVGVDNFFIAETVLGREILNHPNLTRIKFNPINATLLKKHLKNICIKNSVTLKANDKWKDYNEYVTEISKTTGDIRSAISTLQFWATTSTKDNSQFLRENNITYFHAIGKVIYGSKDFDNTNDMVNDLVASNSGAIYTDNFQLGLLENYGTYNKGNFPISIATNILESFSQSDSMKNTPESLEYVTRNVCEQLKSVKTDESSRHGKTYFPREWKIRKLQNIFNFEMDDYNLISFHKYKSYNQYREISLYYGFYGPFIRKKRNYKKKSLKYYYDSLSKDIEQQKQILSKNYETFQIDEDVDIFERLGGEMKPVESEMGVESTDVEEQEKYSLSARLQSDRERKLRKLQDAVTVQEELESFGGDEVLDINVGFEEPIEDSDAEDSFGNFDDDGDDSMIEFLSQEPTNKTRMEQNKMLGNTNNSSNNDDVLSDSDLDDL